MTRRGFALLAVLWVLTALAAITGVGMMVTRLGSEATRNRVLLARAEWAREACGEILQARFATDPTTRKIDSIDLGRGTWCSASITDPSAQINVNTADREALALLLTQLHESSQLADTIIAEREVRAIYNLAQVHGIDSARASRLAPFLTTRGTGVVNINAAPPAVLAALPGLSAEAVRVIADRQYARHPVASADELSGALSTSSRELLLNNYAEFVRVAVFSAPQLVAALVGGVRNTPIVSRATLTVVPVPGRLAVIRRETE